MAETREGTRHHVLGFDTSLATTSACLLRADGEVFRAPAPSASRLLGPAAHSQELLPALAALLDEAGVRWRELESLAVGVGPGTFTGLRIGIATARGLAQALGVGVRPVHSLEALAAGARDQVRPPAATPLLPLIDARRGQVFAALYRDLEPSAARPEAVWEPAAIDPEALLEKVHALDQRPLAVGDWAVRFAAELERAGAHVPDPDSGLHAIDALHVCRLGLDAEPVAPVAVRPLYLRLPDAEIKMRLTGEHGEGRGDGG